MALGHAVGGLGREVDCRGRSRCLFCRKSIRVWGKPMATECVRLTQGWGPFQMGPQRLPVVRGSFSI